ncbi:hypothetical protein FQN50_001648 [Emmonsiellopsis sp. PD_5]|nr:hypothetical protein FQN50_001648 [Emmonsiellopsis sp. PD_5]
MTSPPSLKSLVQSSYDTIAPSYLTWTTNTTTTTPSTRLTYLHRLLPLLPANARVLELGCGAGVPGTQTLLAAGHDVVANDISAVQIGLAREHLSGDGEGKGKVEFIQGDMMGLSFEEGSFDAVVGFYSVLHLPRGEQEVMIQRVRGWVRGGGYLLMNLGVMEGEGEGDGVVRGKLLGAEMFWDRWREGEARGVVERAGIRVGGGEGDGDGLEMVVRVDVEDGVKVPFLWVFGRKGGEGGG